MHAATNPRTLLIASYHTRPSPIAPNQFGVRLRSGRGAWPSDCHDIGHFPLTLFGFAVARGDVQKSIQTATDEPPDGCLAAALYSPDDLHSLGLGLIAVELVNPAVTKGIGQGAT